MSSRFARQRWVRTVDNLIDVANELDPGELNLEQELRMSARSIRRHLERHYDLAEVVSRAMLLRDSIETVR